MIEIPKKLTRKERDLYEQLRKGQKESPFERFKNSFK